MEEQITKVCPRCGRDLPITAYNKGNGKYGHRSICRNCEHLIQNSPEAVARRRQQELARRQDPEYVKRCNRRDSERRHRTIKHQMWKSAKIRALKKGYDFDITEDDIILPEKCPLLGIPMKMNYGKAQADSYSLDRIDSSKGYVKGNVWVISRKANVMKNDATLSELELLVHNLKQYVH